MNNTKPPQSPLSYREAGVDIERANDLVEDIKSLAANTPQQGVVAGIGGFGALYELPTNTQQPILVSSTDGVGTKLLLAHELNQHDTIGIDLVAMCVNDILCQGAKPLYFLDYYATGSLNVTQAQAVLQGITKGCQQADMALIGGETAEMPGMYNKGHYDLAGFCVGLVNKPDLITPARVSANDTLIGIASSGPHANGYSLIRKILSLTNTDLSTPWLDTTIGAALLTPTKIYVATILSLLQQVRINAIAHITGGGLIENIPRVLPSTMKALIDPTSWQWPTIFQWLQQQGNLPLEEMHTTFNCGIGMVIAVPPNDTENTMNLLQQAGETAWVIGSITDRQPNEDQLEWQL